MPCAYPVGPTTGIDGQPLVRRPPLRGLYRYAPWVRRNARRSWPISTENAFRIARPPRFTRPCSMKGSTTARSAPCTCLLYTSDAADDLLCVDLGGRRIIKKKKKK